MSRASLRVMTSTSTDSPELVLLDQLVQDFQGVLLSIHAACQKVDAPAEARHAIDLSLDRADQVLAKWRDRVRSSDDTETSSGTR